MDALFHAGLNNALWATVLAIVAAAGVRIWRSRPEVAHVLWLLVLFKLLAPSLLEVSLPTVGEWASPRGSDGLPRAKSSGASHSRLLGAGLPTPPSELLGAGLPTPPRGATEGLRTDSDGPPRAEPSGAAPSQAATLPPEPSRAAGLPKISGRTLLPAIGSLWLLGASVWWLLVCAARFVSVA